MGDTFHDGERGGYAWTFKGVDFVNDKTYFVFWNEVRGWRRRSHNTALVERWFPDLVSLRK